MNKISLLIIDDDAEYSSRVASYMQTSGKNIDVTCALNGEEGLEKMVLIKPDVVLLDLYMPKLDGMGFLRRLGRMELQKKPIVIVNGESQIKTAYESIIKYNVNYLMIKPHSPNEVYDTIMDLLLPNTRNDKVLKTDDDLVTYVMRISSIPANLKGYRYVTRAIFLALKNGDSVLPITKKLYPQIAKEYSVEPSSVERAIRVAINVSWKRSDHKEINEIFGYTERGIIPSQPSNSEYILTLANEIRLYKENGKSVLGKYFDA